MEKVTSTSPGGPRMG